LPIDDSKSIVLVSCYELGHQPAGISMPMGFLRRAGYNAEATDVSVEGFDAEQLRRAWFVGISVPMHTALRLGLRVAWEIRRINPDCHICFYGLYASLNSDYLLATVADSIVGGEFEQSLVALIESLKSSERASIEGVATRQKAALPVLDRLSFTVPDRRRLPPLERYARLDLNGEYKLVGYVEASRGCLHHCTHCPIPPVYDGRFFVIPREVVLEDIRGLVQTGAQHITFGDPDFLNGPTHALRILRAMHEEFPDVTFDFTAKVEHILKYREMFAELARLGCLFVVSAVESLSEEVLARLEKNHMRRDISEALGILRGAGISLRPSFVAFTPWTTIDDYIEMLEFVEAQQLIDHVDPVQYTIRLLVPPGSLLLDQEDGPKWIGALVEEAFTYQWSHTDPQMDELHRQASRMVEIAVGRNEDPAVTFYRLRDLAYAARGDRPSINAVGLAPLRARPPRLTEAWFC
jgi:radical SAM superfamily enzyme YgiQ (UPF0313 family)